jgi:para-aminobenzoate synthetase component I
MRDMRDDGLPLAIELPQSLTPVIAAQRARTLESLIFLDSSLDGERLGRYSFVAADPAMRRASVEPDAAIFDELQRYLVENRTEDRSDLPPWQGGFAGYFGYELCQALERISTTRFNDLPMHAFDLAFYDVVAAFDHFQKKAWLISSGKGGPPHVDPREQAKQRAEFFFEIFTNPQEVTPLWEPGGRAFVGPNLHWGFESSELALAPQFPVPNVPGLASNFSREDYLRSVQRVIDYIHAGDAFQVNLSQRLLFQCANDPFETYLRLRERNPAPFSAFLDGPYYQIASASPERFLCARDGRIETRPIKGTRRRLYSPEADLFRGDELRASEKDRAENVMIVDLLRNDLSKVCADDSIQVTELCRLENYAFVQHLVSTVTGRLRPDLSLADAVKACFPGGSITGAPKVRAMQIISEVEPTPRGPYCGSLGYISLNGAMDLSILIRTMTAAYGYWQFPVGGGIVADSEPATEYEETLTKAVGLVRSLQSS